MKGLICYYSSTGNTKLACQYIAKHSKGISFELFDIAKDNAPKLEMYDVIGFAAPVEFWGPPILVKMFIDKLPAQTDKPAFVVSTYGLISGKTLQILKDWVSEKGFKVITGYSLQMPENFPPLITKGITSENAPSLKALSRFNSFVLKLSTLLNYAPIEKIREGKLSIGFVNSILPVHPRTKAKEDMGNKYVEASLCIECGICRDKCPYGAIELNPKPVFNMDKCYGCWSCFNHCPNKAIYTDKVKGKGHYPRPAESLKEKLR